MTPIEPITVPIKVHADTTELDDATGKLVELKGARLDLLPGRPVATIATLLLVAALVLGALVAGVAAAIGALPAGFEAEAAAIARWNGVAAAIAVGLLALSRGLLAIGKALAVPPAPLPIINTSVDVGDPRPAAPPD